MFNGTGLAFIVYVEKLTPLQIRSYVGCSPVIQVNDTLLFEFLTYMRKTENLLSKLYSAFIREEDYPASGYFF